jgi:hypothetical protein
MSNKLVIKDSEDFPGTAQKVILNGQELDGVIGVLFELSQKSAFSMDVLIMSKHQLSELEIEGANIIVEPPPGFEEFLDE